MKLLILYLVFARIGLFTIGGGLAALPLLHEEVVGGGWVSEETFIDMIAVSESTPGPIGINMATYIGFNEASFAGALAATAGMVTPSLLVILLIARFMRDFSHHPAVVAALGALRPTAVGLIGAAVGFIIAKSLWLPAVAGVGRPDWPAVALAAVVAVACWRWKWHPVVYILAAALAGILIF